MPYDLVNSSSIEDEFLPEDALKCKKWAKIVSKKIIDAIRTNPDMLFQHDAKTWRKGD